MSTATSPAAWLFAAAWILAAASLLLRGLLEDLLLAVLTAALVLLAIATTFAVTPRPPSAPRRRDSRTLVQAVLLVAMVAFTFVRFGPSWLTHATGWGYLPGAAYLVVVFLLPLAVVVALGAPRREIGLQRGYRAFAVAGVWLVIRAILLAPAVIAGQGPRLAGVFGLNLLAIAIPEEIVFRGLLQTRLSLLLGPAWAVVLTALLFGLWHFGINVNAAGGDLLSAAARSVLVQGMVGLGYSVAFARTRSLISSSLAHAAFNTN